MNTKILFNDGWEFAKSSLGVNEYKDLSFEPIDIPHDWLIYNTLQLYEDSIGWYRRIFEYSREEYKDSRILLYFEGVYMDCALYVNGQYIGEWKYGYSSFEHDISNALREGKNEIILKVTYQSPNSRWYSGAGIYRNVWLKVRDNNHIVTDGIYVSIKDNEGLWQAEVDTDMAICRDALLIHEISYNNEVIASSEKLINAPAGNGNIHEIRDSQVLSVNNPMLWSPEEPNLYRLATRLYIMEDSVRAIAEDESGPDTFQYNKCNNEKCKYDKRKYDKRENDKRKYDKSYIMNSVHRFLLTEEVNQNIGFRTITLDPDKGFILNGTRMKLKGVCEHHDLGALGAAFNKAALTRRFKLLKEMGVNAIRTSHNMPAPGLMDLADETGFLVLSEAFDMWERPKTQYDYARFFPEWVQRDVKSWVMRDRNHPCLMMWSIGNEIYDTHADERGQEITKMLMQLVMQYDPKGNAGITIGSNYMPWENAKKCADILKIAGYNYSEKYYEEHHREHPDWIIFGSETASTVQSRGIYHFPYEIPIMVDDDEQCSSLGNSTTSWGARSSEGCITDDRDAEFSLGQFIWTGFDYIGEPTPYHTKNSYFGQLDTATFKKDTFYIYQAEWTDYKRKPMVHIFPYWDFNKGQLIDVRVCSNAPGVELLLNGKSIGAYDIDHKHGKQLLGWWKLPYEEGEITALAYDEEGNVIASESRRSFGEAARIRLKADKDVMMADGRDLIFVEISMEDKQGNPVENAANRVFVNVTGAGRLIGLDNGDSTDYDQYKGTSRRLFGGKLMAVIASTLEPGAIRAEVSALECEGSIIELSSMAVPFKELKGISAITANKELPCVMGTFDEIPLRKIELVSPSGQELTPDIREIYVEARLYPDSTSYRDVEWSAVNASGIPSDIVKVEGEGLKARITALGDGQFRLRCMSRNGTDKIRLISELEFSASGLGTVYKNPYGFISAGLYDYVKGEIGNGNEKGIATGRDGETHVGYRNIDFGPYGSDTITIPIFALSDDPHYLQIWEGMPGEPGSSMLADVVYQKPSIWNTYQPETYRLSKRLKGISSVCFATSQKIHIKGFSFEQKNRAFEQNYAAECDHISGDSFNIRGGLVENIGNNVALEFNHMDFTAEGASKIYICGRSHRDRNTIRISFSGEAGEYTTVVEFSGSSDGYEEQAFNLEKVTGTNKVTLFLPGSSFDFAWFMFE